MCAIMQQYENAAMQKGIQKGMQKGMQNTIRAMIAAGFITEEQAQQFEAQLVKAPLE